MSLVSVAASAESSNSANSLLDFARTLSRLNSVCPFYENKRSNFEEKWSSTPSNTLTETSVICEQTGMLTISNDPESLATPLVDLNIIATKLNSVKSNNLYIQDFATSFYVTYNPLYESLGFEEDFTITVFIVYQKESDGTFNTVPKLKNLLSLLDGSGNPVPPNSISLMDIDNMNLVPIACVELKNNERGVMPIGSLYMSCTVAGSSLSYTLNQNNNSFPISGGIYLFAIKNQVILNLPNPELVKSTRDKDLIDALNKVNQHKVNIEYRTKGETPIYEASYLEETKFLSYCNRAIIAE